VRLERQSTTVPNTSNSNACTSSLAAMGGLLQSRANEAVAPLGRRQHAMLGAAEQGISVAGHAIIDPVAENARQQAQNRERAPGPAEALRHDGDGVELGVGAAIGQHQVALELVRVEAVMAVERLAERRLRGGEPNSQRLVAFQDELGESRAQHAHAIEYDERLVVRERRNGRVGAIAVGHGFGQAPRGAGGTRLARHAPGPTCPRWRRQWSASTIAIMASPTGTARMPTQGSWRPLVEISASCPNRSTVRRGVRIDEVGFTAKRATIGWPVEMPPRIPPALLDRNCGRPSLPIRISSALSSPVSSAAAMPAPLSTPFTALRLIMYPARSWSGVP